MYRFVRVRNLDELPEVFFIRNRIFVEEKRWIKPLPSEMEYDEWDLFSYHVLAKNDHSAVGTVRLVCNSPLGFPFEKAATLPSSVNRASLYEVSRLAVIEQERGQRSLILRGLIQSVWRIGGRKNAEHLCAVVDQPISRLLRVLGFMPIFEGEPVYHVGSMSVPLVYTMAEVGRVLFSPSMREILADKIEEVYALEDI